MAKLDILAGATSISLAIFIQDSSSTTGAGLTGLVFNTASLVCYAVVPGSSAAAISLATLAAANSAWATGGFKEIDATNMPGWYRFDVPNTNISTGRSVGIHFKGATNMAPLPLEISLTGWNNQDGVRGGLTALPNAAANAAGGLPVSTAGALDLDEMNVDIEAIQTSTAGLTYTVSNQVDVNVLDWKSATAPAMTGDAFARLGAPSGASVSADIAEIEGETDLIVTATNTGVAPGAAGGLFIAGTNAATTITTGLTTHFIGTVDTLTTYTGNTPQTGDSYLRLGAPAGASIAADIAEVEAETDTLLAGVSVTTNNDKTGYTLSNTGIDNILDRSAGVETGFTLRQALRLMLSSVVAKLSGAATTTVAIRDINDTKDRITATVDASGNRTAVTTDTT